MKSFKIIYRILIILISVIFYSCTTDEGLEIKKIRDFDIYANDTINNALVFDMVPTSNGFLIASICGTSRLENKFDGDGRLFLMEVDVSGNVLWTDVCKTSLFESGYPSNLITTNIPDQYYLLWNEFNRRIKLIPLTAGISPDSLSIQELNCNGCRADNALIRQDKLYALGISESTTGPTTIITEFDLNLESSRPMTSKSFDASRFGGFGITDLNFVNRINNFLHLKSNDIRLLYSGPSNSEMIVSHVGELIPEYASNNLWIADIVPNPTRDQSFAFIFQDPNTPQGQSTFVPDIDLSGLPGESNILSLVAESNLRFSSLDPDLPQFIIQYDAESWVVVGTSLTGLPVIIRINSETGEVVRSILGDNTRMDIAKAELLMGELYISGTTVINNRYQRPFLMRIGRQDIF